MLFDFRKDSLSNVVEHKGNYYYVDSCYTLDHGYETMIFPCDENGNVTNWGELYTEWYENATEMEMRHEAIVADIGSVLDV